MAKIRQASRSRPIDGTYTESPSRTIIHPMTTPNPRQFLALCEQAARVGAGILMDWRDKFTAREKGPKDLVTEADLASQVAINKLLLEAHPDFDFLGEEDLSLGGRATSRKSDSSRLAPVTDRP